MLTRLALKIGIFFTVFSFLGFGPHLHELIHHFHEVDHQHQISCLIEKSEASHISHTEHSSQNFSVEKCFVLQHLIQSQKSLMSGDVFVTNIFSVVEGRLSQCFSQTAHLYKTFLDEKQSRAPPYFS